MAVSVKCFLSDRPLCRAQRVEAKEKEDNAMPVVKGKTGRGKVVKVKQETLPTPQGRRVIPRITSAMKADANRKAGATKKKTKVRLSYLIYINHTR